MTIVCEAATSHDDCTRGCDASFRSSFHFAKAIRIDRLRFKLTIHAYVSVIDIFSSKTVISRALSLVSSSYFESVHDLG